MTDSTNTTNAVTATNSGRKRQQFLDKVADMAAKHLYMSATKLSNTLTIGGAANKFKRNPDLIYVPKFRLVGTFDEVDSLLNQHGIDDELGDYYTIDNYQSSLKNSYTDEVEARKLYQESLRNDEQTAIVELINSIQDCRLKLPSIFERRAAKKTGKGKSSKGKRSKAKARDVEQTVDDTESTVVIDTVHEDQVDEVDEVEEVDEVDEVDDEDTVPIDDTANEMDEVESVQVTDVEQTPPIPEEEQSEIHHMIEDVRLTRPKSPKRHPKEQRTRLVSKRLQPIGRINSSDDSSSDRTGKSSRRTRLAPVPINTIVPTVSTTKSNKYSEESSSSTRTRLKPIVIEDRR